MKAEHSEFDCMVCEHPDAPGVDLECYFDAQTSNLWFVYIGDALITDLLRDTIIQSLERGYIKACKEEADNTALDFALARYESKHYETF
jgi:hypothetical protein